MKKYFSILPIINLIMIIIFLIVMNIIGIAIIPLLIIFIYGGIAIVGIFVALLEKNNNIKNIKQKIFKICINFLLTLLIYYLGLLVIFKFNSLLNTFIAAIKLTLESVLAYGITLINKFRKRTDNKDEKN